MTMDCSRAMKSRQQPATVGCDVQDHAMKPTEQGSVLWQRLYFCYSLIFSSLCGCSRVQIHPVRRVVDAIQGQQATCNNHRDTMRVNSSSSTTISEGVCGNTSVWLYNEPHAGFLLWALLAAQNGEMADFQTTTSGAAPTYSPEEVFRHIRRKKSRRAVRTHWHHRSIRRHQAGYSPRHWRDSRAGTTILVHPHILRQDPSTTQ